MRDLKITQVPPLPNGLRGGAPVDAVKAHLLNLCEVPADDELRIGINPANTHPSCRYIEGVRCLPDPFPPADFKGQTVSEYFELIETLTLIETPAVEATVIPSPAASGTLPVIVLGQP